MFTNTVAESTLEILKKLQKIPELNGFYLVGGTSLALQIGHRISIDIDLFGNMEIQKNSILKQIKSFAEITELITFEDDTLNLFIDNLKIDIIKYDYPWIDKLVIEDGIRMCGLKDISAMKVAAIGGRSTKKDFFDLYYLLDYFSINEIMSFFKQKFSLENSFHYLSSLTYFEDAENDVDPNLINNIEWDQVKAKIVGEVKKFSF